MMMAPGITLFDRAISHFFCLKLAHNQFGWMQLNKANCTSNYDAMEQPSMKCPRGLERYIIAQEQVANKKVANDWQKLEMIRIFIVC
jgi:hypothetical protein